MDGHLQGSGAGVSVPGKLRYLWAYSAADELTVTWHGRNNEVRRQRGYDVNVFNITPASMGRQWIPFPELDRMWRAGHKPLMRMYEDLAAALAGRDVLILYNGANLHPEFVRQLDVFKVYTVGDPESAEILGRPLCVPFDLVLVNQMSEISRYKSWGKEHVYFWPLGSLASDADVADLTEESILDPQCRDIPAALVCEYSAYRNHKLDKLSTEFPQAFFGGRGWPRGIIGREDMWGTYRHSRIGWNIHNTTGFNFRTYELPAYGMMEICDNKSDLAQIFDLDREIVGFDTMDECVDKTRYYLDHVDQQRQIALGGWLRWKKDYTPIRVWERLVAVVGKHFPGTPGTTKSRALVALLHEHRRETGLNRILYGIRRLLLRPLNLLLIRITRCIKSADDR
jgi:hypothetical protein